MEVDWILWGPEAVRPYAFPGSRWVKSHQPPHALGRQRGYFEMPRGDLVLFMHQERPLRNVPSVTMMYDTTRVRLATNCVDRRVAQLFFKRVAAISKEIITCTEYSKACLIEDVGVRKTPITVANWPVDVDFARRIERLRQTVPRRDLALYVGRFMPHKNLARLITAFGRTEFKRRGGTLILVGGIPAEVEQMRAALGEANEYVELKGKCPQSELDTLFAGARFLVQPSLEEGFGLPTWEALTCGLPVCVSDGGSLPEITRGIVEPFSATSIQAIQEAIESCAEMSKTLGPEALGQRALEFGSGATTVGDFAEQFQSVLRRSL